MLGAEPWARAPEGGADVWGATMLLPPNLDRNCMREGGVQSHQTCRQTALVPVAACTGPCASASSAIGR